MKEQRGQGREVRWDRERDDSALKERKEKDRVGKGDGKRESLSEEKE